MMATMSSLDYQFWAIALGAIGWIIHRINPKLDWLALAFSLVGVVYIVLAQVVP